MTGILLNLCYLLLVTIALPVVVYQRLRHGKVRTGWNEKLLGHLPLPPDRKQQTVWLHAVSVGEVLQLRQVVEELRRRAPGLQLFISTTTETGYAVAREQFTDCTVGFYPLDFTWSVRRALDRVQPSLIVLVELELWPNFIRTAAQRGIPLVLVNGRLSENSFRGYSRIRPLMQRLLTKLSLIAVQADEYRERFLALGADPDRTLVTGSIKFDGVETERHSEHVGQLRRWLSLQDGEQVLIAGSTQAPEESMALHVYGQLLKEFPRLRLILVPRHPERGDEIAAQIQSAGFRAVRRSRPAGTSMEPQGNAESVPVPVPVVGLLDTVGELGACWGLADVAFVGGSFGRRGGQNMLEPAAWGAAVCFGPNTWNFRQVVELLLSRRAAEVVHSENELLEFARRMLADPLAARSMRQRAAGLISAQRGATDRTVTALLSVLNSAGEMPVNSRSRAA